MPRAPARRRPLTDDDLRALAEGRHQRLYRCLGAQPGPDGRGRTFRVWAPNARRVALIGDFNGWDARRDPMRAEAGGVWVREAPAASDGDLYKYRVVGADGVAREKADPLAFGAEPPPRTASRVVSERHVWGDAAWMADRGERQRLDRPISIYEVHLGSWRRSASGGFRNAADLGAELAEYAAGLGFTHVELMPVAEHPFFGSWGYQVTGYFAPTSRHGGPDDWRAFVDALHQGGVGVIADWVPAHFPIDAHALHRFDGTALYEHPDPQRGWHPDWQTAIFDYGRPEVRSFLLSSAAWWLDSFHIDALRVDAVSSMLYLDYSRDEGQWTPNVHGGNENLEASGLLRDLNTLCYRDFPGVQVIAEESTAFAGVSRPVDQGGLGFGLKWDMGWMHDTLAYLRHDPVHRGHHHDEITFRAMYLGSEHWVLPLSHDEVVHGKGSLLGKMPGDRWQQLANLRLLLACQWMQPGKKLLFMGGELADPNEWDHDGQVPWALGDEPGHAGVRRLVAALNGLYRHLPALHVRDCDPGGFEWIDCDDRASSTLSWVRRGHDPGDVAAVVINFTPVARQGWRKGPLAEGRWRVVLDTDTPQFGGGDHRAVSGEDSLPPLGALVLVPEDR